MKRRLGVNLIAPALALLVLLADQVTKNLVVHLLPEGQSWDLAPWLSPFMRVTHVTNTGVAFGMFKGAGALFSVVAAVVVVVILLYQRQLPSEQWQMRVALGLMLGGAIGNNLIDRPRLGYVTDFIDLNFWPLREWPVSNVADVSIVTGAVLLGVVLIWEERQARQKQRLAEQA